MSTSRDGHRRRRSRSPQLRGHRSSHRRSRSPTGESHSSRHHRDRDGNHERERERHHRPARHSPSPKPTAPVLLPSNAKPIDQQTSLSPYFSLFAKYLDIQKSIDVMDLDERELRSRFKRFVGRWNLGELASSWYDKDYKVQIDSDSNIPKWDDYLKYREEYKSSSKRRRSREREDKDRRTDKERDGSRRGGERHRHRDRESDRDKDRDRDRRRDKESRHESRHERGSRDHRKREHREAENHEQTEERIRNMTDAELTRALQKLEGGYTPSGASEDVEMKDGNESDDSDMIGPALPGSVPKQAGAKAPTRQDLELQRELDEEEAELRRADLRYERKKERTLEKERLEELVPRAEAGSRERQLEKKRETAAANKAFADAKAGGDMEEVGESALMGGDESFQQRKAAQERKKNERELRKEALLRARKAEREERLQIHREKEEQTMKMLRALAEKFR
ncbi:hypothetical protein AA313_de0202794 [Arthrobotrys entomopaga]|nr:hypothetical protein AA313_de0202794 [Arthrobotrys entomopaga]